MRKTIDQYRGRYPPFAAKNAAAVTPAIMGHRGAPSRALENTPDSFALAAREGAEWVELDVRRCRDATLIVHHDPRTRDGVPLLELDEMTLAKQGVWTLDKVLARLPPGLGLNIEIKNAPGEPDYDDEQKIVSLLTELLEPVVGQRPLLASSFNPRTVEALAAGPAGVPAGLLHGPAIRVNAAIEFALQLGASVLCSHHDAESLDGKTVSAAHKAGLAVMVWVVDDPADAVRLADAGVDALCTNDPERLVCALRGQR
jgi:glycerophosphoryl diester phosphodiesterase